MACLGEMNADLMLAARLELASQQGRSRQPLQNHDPGNRLAGLRRRLAASGAEDAPGSPQPVAAVRHEHRLENGILYRTMSDGQIAAKHCVLGQLPLEMAL